MNTEANISLRNYWKTLNRGDKGYILLLCAVFVPLTFKLFSPIFIILGLGGYTDIIMPVLLWTGIVFSMQRFKQSIYARDVIAYLLFAFFFLFSPVIYPQSKEFVDKNFGEFIFTVVPFYFIGLTLNYERDKNLLYFTAVFGVIVQLFWQICQMAGWVEFDVDDRAMSEQMGTAYGFLFSVCFMTKTAIENTRLYNVLLAVISIIMLFLMGSRGPVVVFLFYVAIYWVFHLKFKKNGLKKRIIFLSILILLFIVSESIFVSLARFATDIGLSSRVFESFLSDQMLNLEESSYRDIIYSDAINIIKSEYSGFGGGFGFDRIAVGSFQYAHNFVLEILLDFGRIGGSIILLAIGWMILQSYKHCVNSQESAFFSIILTCGLLSLLFSSTWITSPLFFIFIGYMATLCRFKKFEYQ